MNSVLVPDIHFNVAREIRESLPEFDVVKSLTDRRTIGSEHRFIIQQRYQTSE